MKQKQKPSSSEETVQAIVREGSPGLTINQTGARTTHLRLDTVTEHAHNIK